MTDKEKKAYNKKWRAENAESIKAYRDGRKEKSYAEGKANRLKYITPFYIVYCLMNGRVGITNNPYNRMSNHKSKGRDVKDWFILDICNTKEEAIATERQYHREGASGWNETFGIPQTKEQLAENNRARVRKAYYKNRGRIDPKL